MNMDYLYSCVQNIQRERGKGGGGGREMKREEEVRRGRCLEHSKLKQ